ncbi:MAG: TIGR03016 family PEP-CTERM system-associated outer membrane protein [Geobacteraceae bacterium]|nr:TIGR03016 family PEP-CTERM system-associated outer membrane protein [Geobacteraceae bacterium]NTW79770.1 TIGR03016 family PEP-CTERM system-associated outer membrane protein [Geobacteraceae bacterium]
MSVSILLLPLPVSAADYLFKPFVAISEEVTDNIYELPANKRAEYITRLRPGATLRYLSPLWTWDVAYTFEYRNYARDSRGDEYNHDGALKGNIALIENFLFVDLSDTYRRVTLDASRNSLTESSLFLNQTDQNIAVISPYLLWRLRGDNTLKTGYSFTDTRYWDPTGIEKQEHRGFAELTHDVTSKLSLNTRYAFTRLESLPSQFNKNDVSGGFKYEYAEKSFVFGQIGNSWQRFDTGLNVNYLFWNAGVTHDSRYAVATLETKVATTEDPLAVSTKETSYSGKLEKELQRGKIGMSVSYSEYVNTATNLMDRTKFALSANGRYEILQDLTANLGATGERFSHKTAADYPYRLTGVAGLNYALKNELTLGLTYTYVTDQYELDTTVGAKQVNKAVVEIKKTF